MFLVSIFLVGCTNKENLVSQVCSQDAQLCPDGSSVTRTGSTCEFAACPTIQVSSTGSSSHPTNIQACTEEARLCPDGSAVGRTGPKCEFAPCPKQAQTTWMCASTCLCPEWYRQEAEMCTPECYYSTPKCMAPSVKCESTSNCSQK